MRVSVVRRSRSSRNSNRPLAWRSKVYQAQAEDLHAGRTPRKLKLGKDGGPEGFTVADLCNRFLNAKLQKQQSGELTRRTFDEYRATTDQLIHEFGKDRLVDDLASADFESLRNQMAARWGPVRLGNAVGRVRTVFRYAYNAGLIDRPMRYGGEFKKPSRSVLRRHKSQNGEKMLEADELRRLLDAADVQVRAMLLLAINCAFGNHDVATLPMSAIDLDKGWLDFPRPKTGVERRCKLWPETIQALKAAIAERPDARQEAVEALVFRTSRGRQWLNTSGIAHPVGKAVGKLMRDCGVHRPGLGFYALRHTHRTVADAARDPRACDRVMGHSDGGSMASHYVERIDDSRLIAVTDCVRRWLFGDDDGQTQDRPAKPKRQPISGRTPPVVVVIEFDSRGQRVLKRFDDAYKARQFWVAQDKAGKNPTFLEVAKIG